jgi:hypothetical protein
MNRKSPKNGRVVLVQTRYIGEGVVYAPPEALLVAIDDDAGAIAAVKKFLDFAPNDDRLVEVSNVHLEPSSIQGLGMKHGDVFRATLK